MRKLFVLAAMAAVVAILALGQGQPATGSHPSGLVAYWPFDDGANPTADVAHGNVGTLTNGPAYTGGGANAAPVTGNADALSFDGVNDFVRVANDSSLEPSSVTVQAWVNGSGSRVGNEYILSKGAKFCQIASYALYTAGGGLTFYVSPGSGFVAAPNAGTGVWDGDWHHVVGTYDGTNVRLYVDGTEIGSGKPTTISIGYGLPSGNDLLVGAYKDSCFLRFGGLIDEVCIWDRALGASEITVLANGAPCVVVDTDGDGVPDDEDACPETAGDPERQGCPFGDANTVTLHVVDQAKPKTACPGGKGSCKEPIEGAEVRVFDRNLLNGITVGSVVLTKNPSGDLYDDIFEDAAAAGPALDTQVSACTTDALGECTAVENAVGDYLVIVKYEDTDTGKIVYTGRPKSPGDFEDTDGDGEPDTAFKDFQVIKVIKKDLTVQFSGGKKTVVSGSVLEVVNPDFAIWDDVASGFVYPFIFTSDSDWDVDICAYVPTGYAIVGVYDENGDLVGDSSCTQTFVTGETKVVAYEVVDIGSPEPVLGVLLTVEHEGEVTEVDIEVPGVRSYVEPVAEEPAQLPTTGADPGSDGTPVWLAAAAFTGIAAFLLGSFVVWRRRRA